MAAAPRGGMACLLVDHAGAVIAKIDSGVVDFDSLISDLGKALRPYKILFHRREILGAWEMQVAGDSHWAPYPAPPLVLKQTRRVRYLMAYAFILLALAIGLAKLADNGALDGILGM